MRPWIKELTNTSTDLVLKKKVDACMESNANVKVFKLKSLDNQTEGEMHLEALFSHIATKHQSIGSPQVSPQAASLNFDQFVMLFSELKMNIPLDKLQRMHGAHFDSNLCGGNNPKLKQSFS
jgi:hypothetical protein